MKHSLDQKQLEEKAKLESQEIFQGKVFSLKRDTLTFPDHPPHNWDIIVHPGAVGILPVKENGNLVLIQQWRRAVGKIIYEIPAGTIDPGEGPLHTAEREIQEEVGYSANTFISLGGFYSAPGFCTEYLYIYLAKELTLSPLSKDPHEAIDVVEMSLKNAFDLIESGEIEDAKTICALFLYEKWKKKNA